MSDEHPSKERREVLRTWAEEVHSVADARRIIAERGLRAEPPAGERSVFYFGTGVRGAAELASGDRFTRLEQTEAGYFLDQATAVLAERGLIERGTDENRALFGDRGATPATFGLWGELSEQFATATRGPALLMEDPGYGLDRFSQSIAANLELPALNRNPAVPQMATFHFDNDTREFRAVVPAFTLEPAYVLGEALSVKIVRPEVIVCRF